MTHFRFSILITLAAFLFFPACENNNSNEAVSDKKGTSAEADFQLFTLLDKSETGLDFVNRLDEDPTGDRNVLSFQHYFNGAGVAIGDINNDGKPDVFLSGNEVPNKLFLNKGNLQFEDISEKANINENKKWCTGPTIADVNGDGWNDIYVCQYGPTKNPKVDRQNLLYINNGDGTFSEKAKEYGLNDWNESTQAAFFDYDKDGDLDCYVMNESKYTLVVLATVFEDLKKKENLEAASGNLFRNDGGKFTKVTEEAGMLKYGYGLGLVVSDINLDGWPDVYVANDYSVPDFMYINNGDGTFTDKQKEFTRQISFYGMGADIADINNDGFPDIAVVDMAAEDHYRAKTLMASMDVEGFRYYTQKLGYQYQYMFNTFQLNNGNGTFSNIANMMGVAKTDWSWAALLADFDNDGYKDYFISNGFRRYARDNDFRNMMAEIRAENGGSIPMEMRADLYDRMPQIKLENLIYKNNKDLTFKNLSAEWGMTEASYSSGAAYGDLDGDGDLEIVVNNVDHQVFIYKNNAIENSGGNYLSVDLKPTEGLSAITSKVTIYYGSEKQYQELSTVRGYQGCMDDVLHFGLASVSNIDRIEVEWPNGKTSVLENVPTNQVVTFDQNQAGDKKVNVKPTAGNTPLKKLNAEDLGIAFKHIENPFDDFVKEILLPHRQSALGPKISVADINNDGLEDFYIGGAATQLSALYIQKADGTFAPTNNEHFKLDAQCEDLDALFFDGNGDGMKDLYVVSGGGGEYEEFPDFLQDRLYANTGQGFFKAQSALPKMPHSGNVAKAADFDGDGDLDIFVGGAAIPGKYPYPAQSYLLRNDFNVGKISDVTAQVAPDLSEIGIVKDAVWTDLNKDGKQDLMVVGEWMSIKVFLNEGGKFRDASAEFGTNEMTGWWYSIEATDVDNDGDDDFVVGNIGMNSKFSASKKKPFRVFADDFDGNGVCDIVLSKEYKGKLVPTRGRQCSSDQMPFIKEKFPTYAEFATADLGDILGDDKIDNSLQLEVVTFKSVILINEGGSFSVKDLPNEAQIAPINGIIAHDIDEDGNTDLILAGNNYDTEVETPRYDAGNGLVLKGNGDGSFKPLNVNESGFFVPGNVKDITLLKRANGKNLVMVAVNDGMPEIFEIQKGGVLSMK